LGYISKTKIKKPGRIARKKEIRGHLEENISFYSFYVNPVYRETVPVRRRKMATKKSIGTSLFFLFMRTFSSPHNGGGFPRVEVDLAGNPP